MKYAKVILNYLKERFSRKEITSYIGVAIIALYLFGVINGEQYADLYAFVESFGWGMPVIGAALIGTPTSKMRLPEK